MAGFVARLLAKAKSVGSVVGGFDLPTEFQWEIACRAMTTTEYYWGNAASSNYACFRDNSATVTFPSGATHAVGQKLPNVWGFFDFCGHIVEWCRDGREDIDETPGSENADSPAATGTKRVERGACWANGVNDCTPSYRELDPPNINPYYNGFRLFKALP